MPGGDAELPECKHIFGVHRAQGAGHTVEAGDVDGAWAGCAHIAEGEVRIGGQEHFYLEPQGTLILPGENDEYTVISSTQVSLPE